MKTTLRISFFPTNGLKILPSRNRRIVNRVAKAAEVGPRQTRRLCLVDVGKCYHFSLLMSTFSLLCNLVSLLSLLSLLVLIEAKEGKFHRLLFPLLLFRRLHHY